VRRRLAQFEGGSLQQVPSVTPTLERTSTLTPGPNRTLGKLLYRAGATPELRHKTTGSQDRETLRKLRGTLNIDPPIRSGTGTFQVRTRNPLQSIRMPQTSST
jgi:hypothetical protein